MFGEMVGGTIEGLGSIPELAVAAADEANKRNADFDNVIIEFGRNLREGIADATPIYRTDPNATFDVMDSGWWFSHMPSVASSLSMIVPAKAAVRSVAVPDNAPFVTFSVIAPAFAALTATSWATVA